MPEIDEGSINVLLTDRGLAAILPVRRAGRRLGCTVWEARITTNFGDAPVQIQVYPLAAEPESVVDLEEEITALASPRSPRRVARELRDSEWAILVTCASEHWEIARRFFAEGAGEKRDVAYHPQLDRILGGDLFSEREGHWIKH